MADIEQNRRERPYNAKDDISDLNFRNGNHCNFYTILESLEKKISWIIFIAGLSEFRLDELQEFMA